MTGLRTVWGVSLQEIANNYGLDYKKYLLQHAQAFINQQLLYIEDETILVTKKGKFLCDGIASSLFKIN
jgi:oxygen-independent coproporphyrinogen-3 oxidase